MSTEDNVVSVADLSVWVSSTPAIRHVSFDIGAGKRVGLIGESGSGKTLTALSIMGLLAEGLSAQGHVGYSGRNLLDAGEDELAELRGDRLAMIFQEPMTALNPVMRIGHQIAETLQIHTEISREAALARAGELLELVRLPDPRARLRSYPHQLSGGQRQRVVIAMALANNPSLIIADEPTTALDVTVQAQILVLLRDLVTETGASLLLITHDLAVVGTVCEEVMVMYGGRIVETGSTFEVFDNPHHPYTAGLLAAVPEIEHGEERRVRLEMIPGSVPGLGKFPEGCVFRNRCSFATDACLAEPPTTFSSDRSRSVACHHPVEVELL